ncbi:MAG: hypothetical protein KGS44_00100 [Alphaproteobacteria bacterium]|jgi:hypothetical protein|nr:hypothetical protein [Alphaproteobacteria bacterium]
MVKRVHDAGDGAGVRAAWALFAAEAEAFGGGGALMTMRWFTGRYPLAPIGWRLFCRAAGRDRPWALRRSPKD